MDFLTQFPVWLGVLYLTVEGIKVFISYKTKTRKMDNDSKDEITENVFKMYGLVKEDLETDKIEIRELTQLLKRANLEITVLERKIAALMRVMDSIIQVSPDAHKIYIEAMDRYADEMCQIQMTYKEGKENVPMGKNVKSQA